MRRPSPDQIALRRDSDWIRAEAPACGVPDFVAATAVRVCEALYRRPFWVPRKNNNMLGVRVACIYHAGVIHEAPRDYRELADAARVPRRSVKNMVAATQCGHDDVARRVFRGCSHRSWPARIRVSDMLSRFVASLPWLSPSTERALRAECLKASEALGPALDNHCPNTVMTALVAYTVSSLEELGNADPRACYRCPAGQRFGEIVTALELRGCRGGER